ncbi:MucR family transcriptional regulator [Roseibium sp. RKSG952]|uniref:MucR family transcriptional regulator n=1 Tax=Roseibium sp. RKSG952 TaxID=2529384 RepID=UPI0018AD1739|nr:MucR family transcriptional regulator [Roseibium sp. RKSG952]
MANITLTATAVKALAKRIKSISPELKHTAIINEIASAFGWKGDALMHALKTEDDGGKSEKTKAAQFLEFKNWIDARIPAGKDKEDDVFDDELVSIWHRINLYVSRKRLLEGGPDERLENWVIDDGAIVKLLPVEVKNKIKTDLDDLKKRLKTLGPVDENRIKDFLGKKRACELQPEDSIERNAIICLLDGERKKMLRGHLEMKFGLSAEAYRELFQLPEDYPMIAVGYAAEKRFVATVESHVRNKASNDASQ